MAQIIPAILTSDEKEYANKLRSVEHVSDVIQIDVIDGKFAKNTTVGAETIAKYQTQSRLEVQLMVVDLKKYVDNLVGIDHVFRIIVPLEVENGLDDAIYEIKKHGKQAGLSLNPETPISAAKKYLDKIDLLLLLGVNPGFGGQLFHEIVIDKIKQVKKFAPHLLIEVDGGVNFQTIGKIINAGADLLAANSVLFESEDLKGAYDALSKLAKLKINA